MRKMMSAILAVAASATMAFAGTEPTGIYFNAFTGTFNGTEWWQVAQGATPNQYIMTDIFGGGFTVTVNGDDINFANGSGMFIDDDNHVLFPFGGQFTFDCNRVPFTDDTFPVVLDNPPQNGDPIYAGEYNSLTQFYIPQTGALMGGGMEEVDITVSGTTLRITDPNGLFFQGVFTSDTTVAFRAVTGGAGMFASFPGSSQNVGQNMLGELAFSDLNNFTATVLLQTMAPLGSQQQTLVRFTAERIDPIEPTTPGDLDEDGDVDGQDLLMLLNAWGTTRSPADLDENGVVGGGDLLILLNNWG